MPESKTAQRAQRIAKRPSTWFLSTLSTSATSPALAAVKTPTEQVNPFHAPPTSFRSPHSSLKGKHKLSPSPSPSHHDYDYVISPGTGAPLLTSTATPSRFSDPSYDSSSSPMGDSPTPACTSASGKLRFADPDDSPIRHVPGHSRSLAAARTRNSSDDLFSPNSRSRSPGARSPRGLFMDDNIPNLQAPPPPIFQPIRSSQSQDCNPWRIQRQTRNLRSRDKAPANAGSSLSQQKKAVSLGDMQVDKIEEPFGPAFLHARKARSSMPVTHGTRHERNHRRTPGEGSMSRSVGQKSGLSLSMLSPRTDYTASSSSISSLSSSSLTPPMSTEAVFESAKPMFADVKPNPEVFEAAVGFKQKFKARDSMSSNEGDRVLMPPPSVLRVGTMPKGNTAVKRARSLGHRPDNTPVDPMGESLASKFDFVVNGVSSFAFHNDEKPVMPNTPVKRQAFAHSRMATSYSQPTLGSDTSAVFAPTIPPPPSVSKPVAPSSRQTNNGVPQVTVTATSSPDAIMASDASSSPTGAASPQPNPGRLTLLRRISSRGDLEGSDNEVTPTKGARECLAPTPTSRVMTTPTPSPRRARAGSSAAVMPRLSLPTVEEDETKAKRRAHRQSHPLAPPHVPDEEDIFDKRFVVLGPLGRGAFSSVLQVQERNGTGIYAVKRTRGVFNGVKDRWVTAHGTYTDSRLMHLEEVDILRHLSNPGNDHVLKFVDAWEQNRQLYIQTEACVGSLAAFLEIYGQTNERLDEGRVWKIARDIADGIRHIHSHGVIHFDIKPDNILIAGDRSLKIADFGFATRWPRISPAEIIAGSGLGGSIGDMTVSEDKLHREGDKTYMPPEMLQGVFVMAADVFSFGLVMFETALNIFLPTGGPSWQALRENNFDFMDLSTLSPELANFITDCLNANPSLRPTADQIAGHPVLQRAWSGGPAVFLEDQSWLASILGGEVATASAPQLEADAPQDGVDHEGDVIMSD